VARTRILAFILTGVFLVAEGHSSAEVSAYDAAKEAAIGAALARQISNRSTALDDLFVRDYIRELGHQLARRLPGEKYSWEFEVIRENQGGSTHEAVAIPGGHIFIPAPLILAVENEAELAGMLAHSMAHVAARDKMRLAARAEADGSSGVPLMGPGMGLLAPSEYLGTLRSLELEADRTAVKTVSAAGYDPIGLLEYIRRTQSPATARSGMYSILPPREERIAALEEELADLPTGGRWSSSEFAAVQEKVRQLTAPTHVAPKTPPTLFREDEQ
jgi:predicted Zn-dependent protease